MYNIYYNITTLHIDPDIWTPDSRELMVYLIKVLGVFLG